jgi:prepilin-type N-terminal cleavage/methylation domain-containing protein
MPRAERRRTGFTLLEVLAAVAVLAILYTVLARAGIDGLRAEGEADRRLRAGLLADERLSVLEGQLLAGAAVPVGDTEETVGEFALRISVAPLALTLPTIPEKLAERARERVRSANDLRAAGPIAAAAAAAGAAAAGQPAGSFFAPAAAGQPAPGRQIVVSVTWEEGSAPLEVRRETFGLDREAAAPLLEALDNAAEQERSAAEEKAGAKKRKRNAEQPGEPAAEAAAPIEDGAAPVPNRRAP